MICFVENAASRQIGYIQFDPLAGNIPGKSQIAPLQIVTRLDDFQYAQATAIGVVLLASSLLILVLVNGLEFWVRRRRLT